MKSVDRVVAARGKKVVEVDLRKQGLEMDQLESVVIGPTGNLRAPAIRKGRTLLVGYNEELYERYLD